MYVHSVTSTIYLAVLWGFNLYLVFDDGRSELEKSRMSLWTWGPFYLVAALIFQVRLSAGSARVRTHGPLPHLVPGCGWLPV